MFVPSELTIMVASPEGVGGNLYVDAYHGFAGVLAGSLQDSSPATHRLTSVQSGPLGIRHPALSPRCSKHPVSRSASQPSVSPCVATARSYVARPANTPA